MSQIPERVLLKKDEKYNTGGFYIAYNETAIDAAQDFKEDSLDNYIGYIPEYRVKELLNHACNWLNKNLLDYIECHKNGMGESVTEFVDDFRRTSIKKSLSCVNWEDE